jgi:hypothetical protein
MHMMRKSGPLDGKTAVLVLLSSMQSSVSEWLQVPAALEPYPMPCRVWRKQVHEVARHARAAAWPAYSSLTLRIAEPLEPAFRSNDLPRWAVDLLFCWSRASVRYLGQGPAVEHATELVGLLSMPQLPDHYGAQERAFLLRDLIEDHESDARRSAQQVPRPCSAGTS